MWYDLHVHLAGCGAGESGCYLHPRRQHSLAFSLIRRLNGITRSEMSGDLEQAITERLRGWVAEDIDCRICVLAMDWARDDKGDPLPELTDLYVPNDYVLAQAARCSQMLPGVSIHPYRRDAVAELHRCADRGAVLVKWLPVSQNFSPADERCLSFYDALVARKIPLLCHTGSEGATRIFDKRTNDPKVLTAALERGVKVIAAHSGLRSLPTDIDYFQTWADMLKDYPHLYGDTAAWFGLRARRAVRVLDREGKLIGDEGVLLRRSRISSGMRR